jgi:hypothetical protein|tara:strand:- start:966 stop:1340 length:375 start_codon:yes stop_codon:yes gene_type:complete
MADLFEDVHRSRAYIEAALEYSQGTHTFTDVAAGLLSGRYQLWAGEKSAVVSEITVYPQMKVLNYFLAGGDLDEIKTIHAHIDDWGKRQGCTRATIAGRPGWARTFLKDEGYEPTWFILKKDLA